MYCALVYYVLYFCVSGCCSSKSITRIKTDVFDVLPHVSNQSGATVNQVNYLRHQDEASVIYGH